MRSLKSKLFSGRMLAVVLRALTLASRFLLLFYLATKFDLVQMGLFSLYWAGLQLSASLIPLDVYAQTTRLILARTEETGSNLEKHFGFLFWAILILAPLAVYLNAKFGAKLEGLLLILFLFHLTIEVFATDLSRLLIPLGKPLLSNFSNFLKSAGWIFPLILLFELNIAEISPVTVINLWLGGSIVSVIVALRLSRLEKFRLSKIEIDIRWVKAAISGSFVFLIATLLFRSILGVDKFLVSAAYGEEVVAIYTVYAAGVLGVLALLESGVSAWHYPGMVQSIRNSNFDLAKSQFGKYFSQNIFSAFLLFLGLFLFFPSAAYVFLPDAYFDEISLFFVMSVGVVFYCITMPFHYVIYAFGRDVYFLMMYGVSLLLMFSWYFLFMKSFDVLGAGLMLSGALFSISLLRVLFAARIVARLGVL
ncbi:MAG: hypothetical protein M1440_11565 [Gammaproteobacteria bacterium]|nr:hypothetical protein [Gammaproteobacteria bacterium]